MRLEHTSTGKAKETVFDPELVGKRLTSVTTSGGRSINYSYNRPSKTNLLVTYVCVEMKEVVHPNLSSELNSTKCYKFC